MTDTTRRMFLGALAFAASGLASTRSLAVGNGGHAAGYDVAPASNYVPLILRRPGEHGAEADPLSVIQALMEAERTLNLARLRLRPTRCICNPNSCGYRSI
jgi:hypothetical protein